MNLSLEKTIKIDAPAARVWQVFTDSQVTRELGGEYVTDWQVGSTIGWKSGEHMLTHGMISEFVPGKMFAFRQDGSIRGVGSNIRYELEQAGEGTLLHASERFEQTIPEQDYADASEGWDIALGMVKEVAEK
jgi:uncharacterized protein YndB with AHSA1/START domain